MLMLNVLESVYQEAKICDTASFARIVNLRLSLYGIAYFSKKKRSNNKRY